MADTPEQREMIRTRYEQGKRDAEERVALATTEVARCALEQEAAWHLLTGDGTDDNAYNQGFWHAAGTRPLSWVRTEIDALKNSGVPEK